ncbi:MAG: YkvA family protein [Pseudomonadota bacterium]
MSFRVTFELEEKDLRYFRANIKQAQAALDKLNEADVLVAAEKMVEEIKGAKVPMFVAIRVAKLSSLIDMARDEDWALADKERKNVLSALAYLADPQDMIPDSIPVLGFVDDAIMIELLTSELRPEIDAYNDFCRYRKEEKARNRNPNMTREDYLAAKRKELHGRMRRRRASAARRPSGRTRVRLF